MQTLEAIKTRRSVRSYSDTQKLTPEQIAEVVEYGLYAPSAHNQQARKFFIVTKQKDLDFLGELMQWGKMIPKSSGVVLACFDDSKLKSPDFIQQDMGASIQNILLAIHDKGYGAVWVGTYPRENLVDEIKKYFDFPTNIIPFAILAIGVPNEEFMPKNLKVDGKIEIL
ncbi:MAG TPA: nitroreductase family protein [Candidatus Absconditabacterales bacterium]|nr:nitroreductase family protein [Candidatus Absconditabacterales bacterium]HOQ78986.1 nitroreductase family protein [Candidatus Absconditabacterales bacterium]HPK28016.1 nitroreductase family protein [Candidatus Absconditabacterales bacterium]